MLHNMIFPPVPPPLPPFPLISLITNPSIKLQTLKKPQTLILGFGKSAKFAPDRVPRWLGLSPLYLSLEPGGLLSDCSYRLTPSWAPGAYTTIQFSN